MKEKLYQQRRYNRLFKKEVKKEHLAIIGEPPDKSAT